MRRNVGLWGSSLVLAAGLWLAGPAAAQTAQADAVAPTSRPFLWRIEREPPSFLYGTIHLPDDRVLALPMAVRNAFKSSEVFCSEVPMDAATQQEMVKAAFLPENQTLSGLLPPDLYERTDRFMASKGLPILAFEHQKIWAVATNLSLLDYLEVMVSKPVLDLYLYQTAVATQKQLDALETIQEQIQIMDSIDLEGQISLLSQTLDHLESLPEDQPGPVEKLIEAYLKGEGDHLMRTALEYADMSDPLTLKFLDALIDQRNRKMADGIDARLRAHPERSFFFAIGSLHMPGPEGVESLLTKRGHKLTRVTSE